jgi:hypothetical protein
MRAGKPKKTATVAADIENGLRQTGASAGGVTRALQIIIEGI